MTDPETISSADACAEIAAAFDWMRLAAPWSWLVRWVEQDTSFDKEVRVTAGVDRSSVV